MPDYNLTYNIVNRYFYGMAGYRDGYLTYRELDPAPTPDSDKLPNTSEQSSDAVFLDLLIIVLAYLLLCKKQ